MPRRKRMHGGRRKRSPIDFYMGRDRGTHTELYGKSSVPTFRDTLISGGGGARSTMGGYGGGLADRNLRAEYSGVGMDREYDSAAAAANKRVMQERRDYVSSTFVYKKRK